MSVSLAKPPSQTLLQQVETIYTTLTGLALICLMLLLGMLLPMVGYNPLSSGLIAGIITVVACIGVGILYLMNLRAHGIMLEQARLSDVLMNSLGQGFLTFNAKGVCGTAYSQAALDFLQADTIPGRPIAELLRIPEDKRQEFMEWLGVLFLPGHALSFEDAARFLPDLFMRDDDRSIILSYRAIRGRDGRLTRVVMMATDKTGEKEAQKRADAERLFAAMICAIFAERQSFVLTMSELRILLDRLTRLDPVVMTAGFFRDVHTIKGAAMHFKMENLGQQLHELEAVLRSGNDLPLEVLRDRLHQARAGVQLEYGRIQNALRDILGEEEERPQGLIEVDEDSIYRFGRLLKQQNVTADVYYAYQSTILSVPLFSLLRTLDRQMLPLAEKLEKKVRPITFKGESVRLPARPLQRLLLALTHVVHNILDHGIETPITRMAKGKDPYGQVTIEVSRVTDAEGHKWVEIAISDDGAGIDPNLVRAKLMTADPDGSWRFDDDRAVIQQLLTHNVSTRDEVSLLSGRGAGMSAVYQEVLRLGGRAELTSEMHRGTRLGIHLPENLEARSDAQMSKIA
jgi:two-component system chemotaxis sensor kinase CheA